MKGLFRLLFSNNFPFYKKRGLLEEKSLHNPRYATAHQWYALFLMYTKRFDDAIQEVHLAVELDPLSLVINRSVGITYYYAQKYDQAIKALKVTLEMDPSYIYNHFFLGLAYVQKSMYEKALEEFQKEKNLTEWEEVISGFAYMKMGKVKEAQNILDNFVERSKKEYVRPSSIAVMYLALAKKDQALAWLEKVREENDQRIFQIRIDPLLKDWASDIDFIATLKKMGLE